MSDLSTSPKPFTITSASAICDNISLLPISILENFNLMLLGIYNSATLVSANNNLRKFIHKHALESRLLGLIGQAEMEKGIQEIVKRINQDSLETDTEQPIELDEKELKKYVDIVVREVKKGR